MGSTLLRDFEKRRKEAEDSAKKIKGYESLLKAIKDAGKLEGALEDLDRGIDAKEGELVREAYADFKTLGARYRGQVTAEMTKIQRKTPQLANTDAYADATQVVGYVVNFLQKPPLIVAKLIQASEKKAVKLPTTGLEGEWVAMKRMFEAESGKKKPSETFTKAFRASSGLESALKGVDQATKKSDVEALRKAYPVLDTKVSAYAKLVVSQAKVMVDPKDMGGKEDDDDVSYETALKKLLQGLNHLRHEAQEVYASAK